MKKCPFCLAEIPLAAVKCQHCGEWLDGRRDDVTTDLGRAAQRYISLRIWMAGIGLIVGLLFFFLIWLPTWNRIHREFDDQFKPSALPVKTLLDR